MGAAISCAVHENGTKITSLPPGKLAVVPVAPGDHGYSVNSEATNPLHVSVVAGQTYYATCAVGFGAVAGHPHLSLVDAAEFAKLQPKLKAVAPKR